MSALAARPFGRSGLELTTLGLGGVPLAGLYEPIGDEAALDTVLAAHAGGIRYFDTAPFYGHGLSEHRLGQALRRLPRSAYRLSTKVGRRLRAEPRAVVESPLFAEVLPFVPAFDYSYDGTLRSLEDSLQRLGLARIDLVLVHDPNRRWHGDAWPERFREVMAGAHAALERLRGEGVIGAFGVGAHGHEECLAFAKAGAFDGFMLAGQYTLLDQSAADAFLPYCEARGLGVLLAAPFNSGILATGSAAGARFYYQPAPPEIVERVRRIEAVCARHGVALAAAALQFPLRHPAITAVVPGLQSAAGTQRDRPGPGDDPGRVLDRARGPGPAAPGRAGRGLLSDREPPESGPHGGREPGDRSRATSRLHPALTTLPPTLEGRLVGLQIWIKCRHLD